MRWTILLAGVAIALVASACASVTDAATNTQTIAGRTDEAARKLDAQGEGPAVMAFPLGPSALENVFDAAFPDPLIDPRDLLDGGPPPDGIPSIDRPEFLNVASNLDILPANEPVVALEVNGDARAYPVRALVWHEIINDTVGGVPVVITYCPLCNTAVAFDRRIGGAPTTFGTSGMLYRSALVMYDRATESLWTHFDGTAVIGILAGAVLEEYASPLMAWADFRAAYPTGLVLDWTRTGFSRDYGTNPYAGYDNPEANPDLFRGVVDDRAAAMRRVVGITVGSESLAYPLDLLSTGTGTSTSTIVGGQELVIFWKEGQSSALDGTTVAGGRDVGSVGVFKPVVDGMTLTFEYTGKAFTDTQTGSTWSIAGDAIDGPLAGAQMERTPHFDTFWFAWAAYEPDTILIRE